MSSIYFQIVLWVLNFGSFNTITLRNKAKANAEQAYQKNDYLLASTYFLQVLNYTLFVEPEIRLDLGHCYYQLKDYEGATRQYQRLLQINDPQIATSSLTQMGILLEQKSNHQQALDHFKKALSVNPNNEIARYNYELLKKRHPQQMPPPIVKNQQSPSTSSKSKTPPQQAELEKSDKKQDILNTLKKFDLTEERAKMILDAMKSGEIQYIQERQIKVSPDKKMKQNW